MPRVKITIIFLLVSMLGMAFLSIWLRNEIIRTGYETQVFQEKKKELLQNRTELIVQIEQLARLDRIEEIAVTQLGMKQPDFEQKVYILVKEEEAGSTEQHAMNFRFSKQETERELR